MWTDQKTLDSQRLLNLSVGLASPLWPTFFAAATTGMTYWWMAGMAKTMMIGEAELARLSGDAPVETAPVQTVAAEPAAPPAPMDVVGDVQFTPSPDAEDLAADPALIATVEIEETMAEAVVASDAPQAEPEAHADAHSSTFEPVVTEGAPKISQPRTRAATKPGPRTPGPRASGPRTSRPRRTPPAS